MNYYKGILQSSFHLSFPFLCKDPSHLENISFKRIDSLISIQTMLSRGNGDIKNYSQTLVHSRSLFFHFVCIFCARYKSDSNSYSMACKFNCLLGQCGFQRRFACASAQHLTWSNPEFSIIFTLWAQFYMGSLNDDCMSSPFNRNTLFLWKIAVLLLFKHCLNMEQKQQT